MSHDLLRCDGCRQPLPSGSMRLRAGLLLCGPCSLVVDRAGTLAETSRLSSPPPEARAIHFAPEYHVRQSYNSIRRTGRLPRRWYDR